MLDQGDEMMVAATAGEEYCVACEDDVVEREVRSEKTESLHKKRTAVRQCSFEAAHDRNSDDVR